MDDQPPGYFPNDEPVLRPPWLQDGDGVLPSELIDTRTKLVGRGLPPRDPSEPVFFPGGSPRHNSVGWVLLLADGERVSVDGPIVVGRKPYDVEGFPGARLVAVEDREKTVSKNHAILLPYDGGLFVLDLNSTNGVAVVANRSRRTVTSTEFSPVPDGAVIELGSYLLGVDHVVDADS
ncbi:FHA domain-containing protein [Homoserinibacter sp. GY 40078]|uniref:FHA domain-containing protein n=1 Tax=Homoserinibacter sp. GY 40078 TaxID=2603275 RepID=UPI0011C8DBBE|nr:FHA domain-containing protein [Homoserinibacter sp. GY 40078]TXK16404.1 FHA domain-containing protein [Homoserinibacter sp. GY 40078]